jgi:N-acetylglucosamine-6-phosphate deacetylase
VQVICAPRILLDGHLVRDGWVGHEDGRVAAVGIGEPPQRPDLELPVGVLAPGLVDLQLNGAFGHDLASVDDAGWRQVLGRLPSIGVTAVVPTFVTAPFDALLTQLRTQVPVRAGAARCLGFHLEGPFLSARRRGAHQAELLRPPTEDDVEAVIEAGSDRLRYVTLAPELPGALEAIERFIEAGVRVAIGHSDAIDGQVTAAADVGASMVTHLFNAQRPFSHRDPGVVGAALSDPRFTLGLIADLHHVAPTALRVAFAAAGTRIALVSDAIPTLGMAPGNYEFGGDVVVIEDAAAPPRRLDGRLAGSSLRLDHAVRNVIRCGIDPATALTAATACPADAIGAQEVGRLTVGAFADLVWFDEDWTLRATWVGGQEHMTAEEPL